MATLKNQPQPKAHADHVSRSALRYFGGKWAIAPWVISHLPENQIYVEPFGGAASVLLRKPRSRVEVYNDLDEEIVGLFRVLQDPGQCQRLTRLLRRTPYARGEFERAFEISHDPLVRAQRAIVRSFLSFHHESLFDLRKKTFADTRHGNNSSKAYAWRNYPRALVQICRRLQGVIIERRDALEVIRAQDRPQTLFFIDPPYLPQTRSKSGYRHEMSHEQHVQLLQRLQTIQGRAVVAGYPSELYDDLLSGWKRVERSHYANGSKRPRTEVLWISPAAG